MKQDYNPKSISFRIDAWSKATGIHTATLSKKLTKAGHRIESKQLVSAKQIVDAIGGEKDAAMVRLADERTLALEQKRKLRDESLVEIPTADRVLWAELLGPLMQEMDGMPQKLAQLINPDNVAFAQTTLFNWVEDTKRKMMK